MHWTQQAGIRGGRRLAEKNATATPLGAPVAPQKPESRNGNGARNRPDGLQRVLPKPKAERAPLPDRPCARPACGKWFTPKRPNQNYCPGDCRQRALEERRLAEAAEPKQFIAVLEEVAAGPEEIRAEFVKLDLTLDELKRQKAAMALYKRLLAQAEKAAAALADRRCKP